MLIGFGVIEFGVIVEKKFKLLLVEVGDLLDAVCKCYYVDKVKWLGDLVYFILVEIKDLVFWD